MALSTGGCDKLGCQCKPEKEVGNKKEHACKCGEEKREVLSLLDLLSHYKDEFKFDAELQEQLAIVTKLYSEGK